jgi:hypothetical protein
MLYLYAKPPNMKHIQAFLFLVVLVMAQATAQNVGIGTTNPEARLHIAGTNPNLMLENGGIILIRHSDGSFTSLKNRNGYSVLENGFPSGGIQFRPGPSPSGTASREVVINATGLAIGRRGDLLPNL